MIAARFVLALTAAFAAPLAAVPVMAPAPHRTTPADIAAIGAVLAAYPAAVNAHDRAAFEALLLDSGIPFTAVNGLVPRDPAKPVASTRQYPGFRDDIFGPDAHYVQHFYNVRIDQDGDLAQASLDFTTQDAVTGAGGGGWKVLQLIKVRGAWKIASEFYTVRGLPAG